MPSKAFKIQDLHKKSICVAKFLTTLGGAQTSKYVEVGGQTDFYVRLPLTM